MADLIEPRVILRASICGHHFDDDCQACQNARDWTNHEMDNLRSQVEHLRRVLTRCETMLGNMALENAFSFFKPRWPIHHEPLRSDAKNLVRVVRAALK